MSEELKADAAPESPAASGNANSFDNPWPVAQLSENLAAYIKRLGSIWVEGELTKPSVKGTTFFGELRDLREDMAVAIHSFSSANFPKDLANGDRVAVLVKPEFWKKSGKMSMQIQDLRKVGLGELLERIQRLRDKLTAEGLTDSARKQPIPFLPNCVGLITGKDSDAEKDVLQNAKLRWPAVQFRVINTKVQGDDAAPQIIAALEKLDADPEVDVIIIARGGGAFGDLLVFSDEKLVRAAANAKTPIISAIGHEADRPVLDDVADVRASTPTDAAKLVVPDVTEERQRLDQTLGRAFTRIAHFIGAQLDLLAQLRSRPALANPYTFIEVHEQEIDDLVDEARGTIDLMLEREGNKIDTLRKVAVSLSPQSTLDRGYSVVRDADGHVFTDASKIKTGTKLKLRLAKGETTATAD
jgi:exodeoxyribonuclease VII large subunit